MERANLHLFTGDNTYAKSAERARWLAGFVQKHGESNVAVLQGGRWKDLIAHSESAPFCAERRLVLVDGLPRGTTDDVDALRAACHPQVVVLLVDTVTERRKPTAIEKHLRALAEVHEFPQLRSAALRAWVEHQFREAHVPVIPEALDLLLKRTGADQALLASEIPKLVSAAGSAAITPELVEALVLRSAAYDVWSVAADLADGKPLSLLHAVESSVQRMECDALWNTLLWTLQLLSTIGADPSSRSQQPALLARQLHAHSETIAALQRLLRRIPDGAVTELLSCARIIDRNVKRGNLRSGIEAQAELAAALDLLLLQCAVK